MHCLRHPTNCDLLAAAILLLSLSCGLAAASGAAAQEKPKRKKPSRAEQFLIFGTVFDERGFALPGAEIFVRRAGEKKTRWRQYSDARGEFGVRVPPGAEYEMMVKAKGYVEQTRSVDARRGSREDTVFHMQPVPGGKKE